LKYYTGLSPKSMARLIRFDAACSLLAVDSTERLTDPGLRHGLYRPAHLNHEFKTFTGKTRGKLGDTCGRSRKTPNFYKFS